MKVIYLVLVFSILLVLTAAAQAAPESGYVEAMVKLGLAAGTGNNTMGAAEPIKRQDAAVLLARALPGQDMETISPAGKYLDEDQISPYAVKSVAYITWKYLMNGSEPLSPPGGVDQGGSSRARRPFIQDWEHTRRRPYNKPAPFLFSIFGTWYLSY